MEIRYFAWVRERVGVARETYEGSAQTISELVAELKIRGENYMSAFSDENILRFAIDQEISEISASINGVRELAIFPPMTGG